MMPSVRVIEGDCLAVLPTLPDASVDAVVTDPPYNVGFAYKGDDSGDRKGDYAAWCRAWLAELRRVCRGPIAVSVGQSNLSLWATIAPPEWWLAWWKPAAMGRCVAGFNNWEPIALYGKPWRGGCDVIRAPIRPDAALAGHPCPKPLEWARAQLRMLCPPGGTVLDPFGGSGTTAIAAMIEGHNAVLIEREPAYCEIIRCRIAAEEAKTSLFNGGDR